MRLAGLCIVAVLGAVSQAARADPPVGGAVLGQAEAVLDRCQESIPAGAERYKALAKGLTGDATDKELNEVRNSTEYRDAYDAASAQLDSLPKEESDKACGEGLKSAAN
jgi:hypothetical protein